MDTVCVSDNNNRYINIFSTAEAIQTVPIFAWSVNFRHAVCFADCLIHSEIERERVCVCVRVGGWVGVIVKSLP